MSRGVIVLIAVSLLLNAVAFGVFTGYFVANESFQAKKLEVPGAKSLGGYPRTKVSDLVEKLNKLKSEGYAEAMKMKAVSDDIYEVLIAEEFDENLYTKKIEKVHNLHFMNANKMAEAIKVLCMNLSREERLILAEIMKSRPPGSPPPPPPPPPAHKFRR